MYPPCVFALPFESEEEPPPYVDEAVVLLQCEKLDQQNKTSDTESSQSKKRKERPKSPPKLPPPSLCTRLSRQCQMIKWHILAFAITFGSLYAVFHGLFNKKQKVIILNALDLFDDWRPFVFVMGIYCSFAIKKVSDISSVSQ
jgi:hypothetical protein